MLWRAPALTPIYLLLTKWSKNSRNEPPSYKIILFKILFKHSSIASIFMISALEAITSWSLASRSSIEKFLIILLQKLCVPSICMTYTSYWVAVEPSFWFRSLRCLDFVNCFSRFSSSRMPRNIQESHNKHVVKYPPYPELWYWWKLNEHCRLAGNPAGKIRECFCR